MENEIIQQILDKINSTIADYKNDRDLTPGERTWAVCALTDVKIFVQGYV